MIAVEGSVGLVPVLVIVWVAWMVTDGAAWIERVVSRAGRRR